MVDPIHRQGWADPILILKAAGLRLACGEILNSAMNRVKLYFRSMWRLWVLTASVVTQDKDIRA